MQRRQAICETCGDGSVECLLVTAVDEVYHDQENLLAIDCLGRLSLHYGELYGFGEDCQRIIHHWGRGQASRLIFTLDSQGYTPFHYAVVENHVSVARVFINILLPEIQSRGKPDKNTRSNMQNLLNIAIRYQFDDMVELLGESQLLFGGVSAHEESPLYVAAQIGRDDYLDILLRNGQMELIDGSEALNGWTPLFIACINGHRKAAELLLKAGANQEVRDFRESYPKEHAALRGHFSLAELLKPWDRTQMTGGPARIPLRPSRTVGFHLPVNVDQAIVNIGTLQNGRHQNGIDLKMPWSKDNILPLMNMSVSVGGSVSHLVHLPVLGDMSNEPLIFPIHDPSQVHLVFKFFSADSSREGHERIGSASILLQEEVDCFGPNRESLFRARTIPILAKETSDLLGTVTFTFLIAKKLMNLRKPPPIERYNPEQGIRVVGHRGLKTWNMMSWVIIGLTCNKVLVKTLQIGVISNSEKTQSSQGASYVESTDVQRTRDLVPVVFHDFSLSESGTDVPVHDLTFDQGFDDSNDSTEYRSDNLARRRPRARSLTTTFMQETHPIRNRMKYTVDFKNKGSKPNTRGSFIHGPFTNLKELLVNLPESIGFNVEIKYPRLHEAIEAGVAPVALEINLFVDRILYQIFNHTGRRKIILSSFTPEICILLATKQQTFPVMFITNAGKPPASDLGARACSVKAAVRFSKRWNLAGIVFASDMLLMCPSLVGYIKQSGFICGSYGSLNNVPENVKVQQAADIQILMADRVGVVSMVLNESHTI
ncbi:hypothetical protein UA08_02537 [Talaromyces atroroseus]|uniref:GP-PDE domain-containing protein n=1 Tax=Talaromyces atroroseus TaxID=1441469 RepID=A0A225AVU6_TALAT|nr:hypothetical protein UA08_02537 [Talaromyces atroroseus]OKL62494.1 hypothetical protein UA08_02537 [Talaromyces atroroseus]